MILHTIVPPELIFQQNEEAITNQMSLSVNGVPMVVEQDGHQYKIIRLLSSNPGDYLRNDLSPGSYISIP